MNVSLRPWSVPRVSLPMRRMFIAVYEPFVADPEGGRLPPGSNDESRVILDTALFSVAPKTPTATAAVAKNTPIATMATLPHRRRGRTAFSPPAGRRAEPMGDAFVVGSSKATPLV